MQIRRLGRSGRDVSALGFGCMRLPTLEGGAVNEPLAIAMLREAVERGVNYFDTAWPYHGGQSEVILGRALRGEHRDEAIITTKLPAWQAHSQADCERLLAEQLARLGCERVDYYLLHNLNKRTWEQLLAFDVLAWLERIQADGRVGGVGFSFHAGFDVLKDVVDAYDRWTICQIQYNYVDEFYNAGTRGLHYAADKGLGVVVMEPLLGGRLVTSPPAVQAIWDAAPVRRSPVEWALSWLWDKPEVSVVLSGMSAPEQLRQNVTLAERASIGMLTDAERVLVAAARDAYLAVCPSRCTGCKYCEPCPNGVDIPVMFKALNQGIMAGDLAGLRRQYVRMAPGERAEACIACHVCEERCPQSLPIAEWMAYMHQVLGEGRPYKAAERPQG
jgi:predicted aldo/keto reductase-like oxidoreductase